MKRILFLAALATMVMACEKYTSDKPESSGVYLNGRCVVPIGSTFMGGGVAEPSKGSSHRCHMYEYGYEKGPLREEATSPHRYYVFKAGAVHRYDRYRRKCLAAGCSLGDPP